VFSKADEKFGGATPEECHPRLAVVQYLTTDVSSSFHVDPEHQNRLDPRELLAV
jgi:hypothetical protein